MEHQDPPAPRRWPHMEKVGRREALGLGVLGVIAGSALIAGDTAASAVPAPRVGDAAASSQTVRPARSHQRLTGTPRPAAPPPTTPPAAPPPPGPPVAAWKKPAFKVADLLPEAPPNAIALTIDDGPNGVYTPHVLDLLAKYDVKATFCMIGSQIKENAKVVRLIADAGHEIANHTWTHPYNITKLTDRALATELSRTYDMIGEMTGEGPRLFRSPGGVWSKRVFGEVAHQGMIPIDWDIDPRDWTKPGVGHITHAMLAARPGDIVLCHDGGGDRSQTLNALRVVVPRLKRRGLQFVTL